MISLLMCWASALTLLGVVPDTTIACVPEHPDNPAVVGWYDGYQDTAYVVQGLGHRYTVEVLWHELAHAWDLKKGTELNGYPSFFSETHTGFDLESFARLQTLRLGVWPEGETYPDTVPTDAEWAAMGAAGWLWTP